MNLFSQIKNAIFGGSAEASRWNVPESERDIDEIFEASRERPQLLYKHSNSCSVSWISKSSLESKLAIIERRAGIHHVDVVRERWLSDLVTARSGVPHQSPQALLIHDLEVVWHSSHMGVRADAILETLQGMDAPEP